MIKPEIDDFDEGKSFISVARIIYPLIPGKRDVYKSEKFGKFLQKVYPLPCNYACENGLLKIVQLINV